MSKYRKEDGFLFEWEPGFSIKTINNNNVLVIKANKFGLISLANHLKALADDIVPDRYHIHLDDINSLEEGSVELIIEKDN